MINVELKSVAWNINWKKYLKIQNKIQRGRSHQQKHKGLGRQIQETYVLILEKNKGQIEERLN